MPLPAQIEAQAVEMPPADGAAETAAWRDAGAFRVSVWEGGGGENEEAVGAEEVGC